MGNSIEKEYYIAYENIGEKYKISAIDSKNIHSPIYSNFLSEKDFHYKNISIQKVLLNLQFNSTFQKNFSNNILKVSSQINDCIKIHIFLSLYGAKDLSVMDGDLIIEEGKFGTPSLLDTFLQYYRLPIDSGDYFLKERKKLLKMENIENKIFSKPKEHQFTEKEKKEYIEDAVVFTDMIKEDIVKEKKYFPEKFVDIQEEISMPKIFSNPVIENEDSGEKIDNSNSNGDKKLGKTYETKKVSDEEYNFVLSLLGQQLEDEGIEVGIYKGDNGIEGAFKNGEEIQNVAESASMQYVFNNLSDKKQFECHFDFDEEKRDIILNSEEEFKKFSAEWKVKLSNQLGVKPEHIIITNPKRGSLKVSVVVTPEGYKEIYEKTQCCGGIDENSVNESIKEQLEKIEEIKDVKEMALVQGCKLSKNIFDERGNNEDGGWGVGEKRGGEDYIPPFGYKGYGISAMGKYDGGNDDWLSYNGRDGEFAVAYLGIGHSSGKSDKIKDKLSSFTKNINSVKNFNVLNSFADEKDLRHPGKKCGKGVYLFQDPRTAECNGAHLVNILGVTYKILLMCRVNPKKIRQPASSPYVWILQPTPDEIRPYRILVKTVLVSEFAQQSKSIISAFSSKDENIINAIQTKNEKIYSSPQLNKYLPQMKDKNYMAVSLYTSDEYKYINNYLRFGKIIDNKYSEEDIKSWIFCLHKELTSGKNKVPNKTKVYRGVRGINFPESCPKGSKFYLKEFLSTSLNKNIANNFSSEGGCIMEITLLNTNNTYCKDVTNVSIYPSEKEVLLTSHCEFTIQNIRPKSKNGLQTIELICEGYNEED